MVPDAGQVGETHLRRSSTEAGRPGQFTGPPIRSDIDCPDVRSSFRQHQPSNVSLPSEVSYDAQVVLGLRGVPCRPD